jgi:branched-chain amino acid transport system permease protein
MRIDHLLRSPRVLLALVAIGLLWPAGAAQAQEADEATCPRFTKADAVEANGEPLGNALWGRLCQVIDGEAATPEGVVLVVRADGEEIGRAATDAAGVFVVPIPGNGTYQVALDPDSLPDGFALTDEDRATLDNVAVNVGDQQVSFRLGEDSRGQRELSDYLTTFAKGLRLGLIIAVAAVGLSLIYGVTGLINFAHAELVSVGALVALTLDRSGVPFLLSVLGAVAAGGLIGWGGDRALWRPLRRRNMALLSQMVVSIGLGIAARNIFLILWGPSGRRYGIAAGQIERDFGPFRLTPNDLLIMGTCIAVLAAMTFLLRRTRVGTAIRAVADNPDLAASSGIAVDRIITVVWVLCGALAALGGVLYGLSVDVKYDMGFLLLLSMFAAVVLGGLGNAYGAVLGAIVIGVVQETSGLFVDTAYKFVVALVVLILVLLVRPQGILGRPERFG